MTAEYFETPADAYAKAKRMARHGHRDWIVWQPAGATGRKAARLCRESLEEAIGDTAGAKFSCIQKNYATGLNVHPALASVWLENMKAGTFFY